MAKTGLPWGFGAVADPVAQRADYRRQQQEKSVLTRFEVTRILKSDLITTYDLKVNTVNLFDPSDNTINAYLPRAQSIQAGTQLIVKNNTSEAINSIIVNARLGETVSGASNVTFTGAYSAAVFFADPANKQWLQV